MQQLSTKIISNERICTDFYRLRFEWPTGSETPRAGQFLTVRASHTTVPFLRRPLAFSEYTGGIGGTIYQKRGTATEIIAGKDAGDSVDLIAPLGNHFEIPHKVNRCILVAGGIGLGPMLFLASTLKAEGRQYRFVFGARSREFVPGLDVFGDVSAEVCTDDGSGGRHGTTVDYLKSLDDTVFEDAMIVACGPHPMLSACHEFAVSRGLQCLVSMEQVMACGVGACMGCVIRTVDKIGYARVCADGPVFNSRIIKWS